MIDSITTFNLTDVLVDEPQLQPILNRLAEKVSSFYIADGTLLGSLVEEGNRQLPLIILRSQRITVEQYLDFFQSIRYINVTVHDDLPSAIKSANGWLSE